jgi:hypothetical protein
MVMIMIMMIDNDNDDDDNGNGIETIRDNKLGLRLHDWIKAAKQVPIRCLSAPFPSAAPHASSSSPRASG